MKRDDNYEMLPLPKALYKFLLIFAAASVVVSMVSGPLGYTGIAIGSAASAVFLALCLLAYGLYTFRK